MVVGTGNLSKKMDICHLRVQKYYMNLQLDRSGKPFFFLKGANLISSFDKMKYSFLTSGACKICIYTPFSLLCSFQRTSLSNGIDAIHHGIGELPKQGALMELVEDIGLTLDTDA